MPKKRTANRVLDRVVKGGGKVISLFTALLAAFLILYSSYVIYDTFYIQNQAFGNTWDLLQYRPEIIDDGATPLSGADTLASINKDYRAWLTLYDTFIDYPVMQGENDLYYASHDIYKKTSLTGALYLASGNSPDFSDTYNLIYGHHMDNSALFGAIDKFADTNYFNQHREGILVTKNKVFDLRIFAMIQTDAYEDMVYNVGNRNLTELINFIRRNNLQFDASALEGAKQIIAFSTCESAETNGRYVLFAVMTERDMTAEEEPTQPGDDPTNPDPGPDNPGDGNNPGDNPDGTPDGTENTAENPDGNPDTENIDDAENPLSDFFDGFTPTGGVNGEHCWALINLICLIFTVYILLPLTHIKAKISRGKMMHELNEDEAEKLAMTNAAGNVAGANAETGGDPEDTDELLYKEKQFKRRFFIGIILEIIIAVVALIAFILTEDMRLPMVLIDKWTPLMLLLFLLCWIADLLLVRYRKKMPEEEEEETPQDTPNTTA